MPSLNLKHFPKVGVPFLILTVLFQWPSAFAQIRNKSKREKIPTVDFCTLLRRIYRYVDRPVRTTARWERSGTFFVLRDARCQDEFPIEAVVVPTDNHEPAKTFISRIESTDFGGRATVTVVGTLHDPTDGEGIFRFLFQDLRFEQVDHFVTPYKGAILVNNNYRVAVRGDKDYGLRLVNPLRLEFHTAMRIEWVNLSDFPMLERLHETGGQQTILFRVISDQRIQMTERRWNRTLTCKILRID